MNDYNKKVIYRFNKLLTKYDIAYLQSKLAKVEGIDSFEIFPKSIGIEYVTIKLTAESVKEVIRNLGYRIIPKERKKL